MSGDPTDRVSETPPEESEPANALPPQLSTPANPPDVGRYRNIIITAAVAFCFGLLTNVFSNYLTRRDQHVQEAERCTSLAASLMTTTALVQEFAQIAAASIKAPVRLNMLSNKFTLPPLDEMLHSEDASLEILDASSRENVLRVEAYYRSIRDDLANTPGNYHTGETFGVPPGTGNQDTYEHLLSALAKEADYTTHLLGSSRHCKSLVRTDFFWPAMRKSGRE